MIDSALFDFFVKHFFEVFEEKFLKSERTDFEASHLLKEEKLSFNFQLSELRGKAANPTLLIFFVKTFLKVFSN